MHNHHFDCEYDISINSIFGQLNMVILSPSINEARLAENENVQSIQDVAAPD